MYNLLNATMSRQAEALELIHSSHETNLTFQCEKESKKKDCFSKIHPDTKKMITFASAPDAEAAPNVPEDTCKRFINATSQGIAEQDNANGFRRNSVCDGTHLEPIQRQIPLRNQEQPTQFQLFLRPRRKQRRRGGTTKLTTPTPPN
jgi:hypothetical protein